MTTLSDAKPDEGTTKESRRAEHDRKTRNARTITAGVAVVAAAAACFAPVTLTGNPGIDMVERALVAGLVTFVGAHAHRWSWLAAAVVLAVPARGTAMVMLLAALALAVVSTSSRRRPKSLGVLLVALLANVPFWYTDDLPAGAGAICALVAFAILLGSGLGELRSKHRRWVKIPLAVTPVIVIVALAGTGWAALSAQSDLREGTNAARAALNAVEQGDAETARISLDDARRKLGQADDHLGLSIAPASLVPGLAQQVHAVEVAVAEGINITSAADGLLASTNYDDLRYNGRLDLDQIADLEPGARDVKAVLARAEQEIEKSSAGWLVPPLRHRVDEFHDEVSSVRASTDLAADLLRLAPDLFGADEPRHYLVVFLTPAEIRGAGGFIGSYAELTAMDGEVDLSESGPIRDLIGAARSGTRTISGPPDYLRRYGRFRPADYLQDLTLSPDFPSVAQVAAELYPQSGGRPVDGVIGVDPTGLAALLELTGPVQVEGLDTALSADNAVDLLTRDQYLMFDENDERKDLLEAATRATFRKLTKSSLPAPRKLASVLGPVARGRHLQLWSPLPEEQALFAKVGAIGKVEIPKGSDGFSVIQQNGGNNKIDAYMQRTITYDAVVDPTTGGVSSTLTIVLHNAVPDGIDQVAVVGNQRGFPIGSNVSDLSVYTPLTLDSGTLDGQPVQIAVDEEFGLTVLDLSNLVIGRGESATIVISLEGGIDLSNGYHLMVLPQPVANPDVVNTTVELTEGRLTGPMATSGGIHHKGEVVEPLRITADVDR